MEQLLYGFRWSYYCSIFYFELLQHVAHKNQTIMFCQELVKKNNDIILYNATFNPFPYQ